MIQSPTFRIRIRGPWACFTRPEMKAERVSYEVITPSATRGILEAVLWKPAIRWSVERIHVLAPIRFMAIKRNEVKGKVPLRGLPSDYYADMDRAQRNSILLRDVDYVVEAHFTLTRQAGPEDNLNKFVAMFQRRLQKGQCFHTPYLGCREFAADVTPAPEAWSIPEDLTETVRPLGLMLHDLEFSKEGPRPFFFEAVLDHGCIQIPEVTS